MAKLIWYRIIAALQFFFIFFYIMTISDYMQYDAKMFDTKINMIYENKCEYLDCRVSDFVISDENPKNSPPYNESYYSFYDHFQFDLDENEELRPKRGYATPTFCVKLPDEVTWIEGSKPSDDSEIAIGKDLYDIMKKCASQPITVGSRITLKSTSLIQDSYFPSKEVTIKGIYSSSSLVLLMSDFRYPHLIAESDLSTVIIFKDDYNQFNESFYMRPRLATPNYVTPTNILVKVPNDKNELVNMYKEDRRVRYCIDNFDVEYSSSLKEQYQPRNNLVEHKKYLETCMIVCGIISVFSLFLLVLYLFASTQWVIIERGDKSIKNIFAKELLFYALLLLGGGVVLTIYNLISPLVMIVQPILISLLCFVVIIIINWLLIFIWQYKELSKPY